MGNIENFDYLCTNKLFNAGQEEWYTKLQFKIYIKAQKR